MTRMSKMKGSASRSSCSLDYYVIKEPVHGTLVDFVHRLRVRGYPGTVGKSYDEIMQALAGGSYLAALDISRREDTLASLRQIVTDHLKAQQHPEFCESVKGKLHQYASELVKLKK